MNRKILYTLVLLLFFAACKYEDDPSISLHSKYHRLEGYWKIDHLEIDGVDSTQRYIDSCNCNMFFTKVKIPDNSSNERISLDNCRSVGAGCTGLNGLWKFIDNKKILHITLHRDISNFVWMGPFGDVDSDWKILRLTKTEFWFTTTLQNKIYEFKFKR